MPAVADQAACLDLASHMAMAIYERHQSCHRVMTRRHNLCRLLHLSAQPLGTVALRNIVYLVRADIANAQQIAAQVKALNR